MILWVGFSFCFVGGVMNMKKSISHCLLCVCVCVVQDFAIVLIAGYVVLVPVVLAFYLWRVQRAYNEFRTHLKGSLQESLLSVGASADLSRSGVIEPSVEAANDRFTQVTTPPFTHTSLSHPLFCSDFGCGCGCGCGVVRRVRFWRIARNSSTRRTNRRGSGLM
jgi:hypothetical protein